MAKLQANQTYNPDRGAIFSVRFVISLVLMIAGIAWLVYFNVAVQVPGTFDSNGAEVAAKGPTFVQDLGNWNYLIGFGAFFLGLIIAAHPSTPLGRGRGVVVGMLGCFLIGLAWICTFYAIANNTDVLPVFDDLGQKNLIVGIAFMAVGFTFATRWE